MGQLDRSQVGRTCFLPVFGECSSQCREGGRFEWHTPGVLTLLAFASLVAPLLVRLTIRTRASILLMMAVSPIILGDASGLGWTWWDRVSSEGSAEWIARLLWNGTYPLCHGCSTSS